MKATAEKTESGGLRRLRRWLLLAAYQVVAVALLLEVGARLIDPMGISYYPETAHLLDQMILEEPIGYRLPPGLAGSFYGAYVETNSLGMRDREVPAKKAAGERRILVIGDSAPFSIGVEFEDSIPYQLEQLANERAPAGRHYRTLNMGVPSYNTEQELIQLKQLGLSLDPDVAVLLFIRNDLEDKMWVFEKRANWLVDFAQRSYAASALFAGLRNLRRGLADDAPDAFYAAAFPTDDPRWHSVEAWLTEMNRVLTAAGIPFVLLHWGSREHPSTALLEELGEREGFPVRGMNHHDDPRYRDLDARELVNSATDAHCNPRGCQLIAAMLYEVLLSEGVLD